MPDATLDFLKKFADESAWDKIVRGVTIFTPHSTEQIDSKFTRAGEPYKVDVKRLERIAQRINRLEEHYGVVMRLIPEHTKLVLGADGRRRLAPQAEQPPTWGFARNARVGPWGPKRKPGLLADWYILPGKLQEMKDRQFCSSEFNVEEDEIRAVAVIKTQPVLDMGMVAYGGDGGQDAQYQCHGQWVFYSMEIDMDPTVPPDAAAPDDDFAKKCAAYMASTFPNLAKMHEAYSAAQAAPPPAAPPPGAPPAAPPAAATPPAAPPAAPPPAPPGPPKPGENMSSTQIPEQYAKVFAAQNARVAALEKQLRKADYSAELAPLCEQYGLTLADELGYVEEYDRPRFDLHKKRLAAQFEAYAAKQLVDPQTVDTSGSRPGANPNPGGKGAAADLIGTEAQLERAIHYQREFPGCSGDDSWEYATSTAKTPREFRRNGQAAKK